MNLGPGSHFNQLTLPTVSFPIPLTLPPLSNLMGQGTVAPASQPVVGGTCTPAALASASADIAEILREEQDAMLQRTMSRIKSLVAGLSGQASTIVSEKDEKSEPVKQVWTGSDRSSTGDDGKEAMSRVARLEARVKELVGFKQDTRAVRRQKKISTIEAMIAGAE